MLYTITYENISKNGFQIESTLKFHVCNLFMHIFYAFTVLHVIVHENAKNVLRIKKTLKGTVFCFRNESCEFRGLNALSMSTFYRKKKSFALKIHS